MPLTGLMKPASPHTSLQSLPSSEPQSSPASIYRSPSATHFQSRTAEYKHGKPAPACNAAGPDSLHQAQPALALASHRQSQPPKDTRARCRPARPAALPANFAELLLRLALEQCCVLSPE